MRFFDAVNSKRVFTHSFLQRRIPFGFEEFYRNSNDVVDTAEVIANAPVGSENEPVFAKCFVTWLENWKVML